MTGLPVRHMDLIHWKPGWEERPRPEKIAMARAVEAEDSWIFEGGLRATYDTRAARADLIVFLDLPMTSRLWRALVKRRLQYAWGIRRPALPPDCPERFNWEFVRWIVGTARPHRRMHLGLIAAQPPGKGVHLEGRRAAERWLRALEGAACPNEKGPWRGALDAIRLRRPVSRGGATRRCRPEAPAPEGRPPPEAERR